MAYFDMSYFDDDAGTCVFRGPHCVRYNGTRIQYACVFNDFYLEHRSLEDTCVFSQVFLLRGCTVSFNPLLFIVRRFINLQVGCYVCKFVLLRIHWNMFASFLTNSEEWFYSNAGNLWTFICIIFLWMNWLLASFHDKIIVYFHVRFNAIKHFHR